MTDEELDGLVREDIDLGRRIWALDRMRHAQARLLFQQIRQLEVDFARESRADRKRREAVREEILAIWKARHDGVVTLDLPSADVSRRTCTDFKVLNQEGLYDALDRADRLDLADYAFDEKEVFRLIRNGKLPGLREDVVQVTRRFDLQVKPREPATVEAGTLADPGHPT